MKILYLGAKSGTSKHRAEALVRLGHQVLTIDPDQFVPRGKVADRIHWETGGALCQRQVAEQVWQRLGGEHFDLTWVNGGRNVGPALAAELRRRFGPIINYNNDDPYGTRDRNSWFLYRKAVPVYDLVTVVRQENVSEAQAMGAKNVLRVFMSADEVVHAPRILGAAVHARWNSEVLFIGTWMPERGPFLAELIRRGVPLTLYGGRWERAREWPQLRAVWKGPTTTDDNHYALAIQCAKVCLGLLSKGNRDLHTQRSLEVPLLGGVLCGQRTSEHQRLYAEGEEAVFWSDAEECAAICHKLLADDERRREIARQGQLRCVLNGHLNEQVVTRILEAWETGASKTAGPVCLQTSGEAVRS